MKNESQYGLLLLQQYLYEHTDDQHPPSVADILAYWREHGIQAGRKSVYSAIEVLQSNGMDIVCVKSTQNRYFVGERLFELPELKLLVDAVESPASLRPRKANGLLKSWVSSPVNLMPASWIGISIWKVPPNRRMSVFITAWMRSITPFRKNGRSLSSITNTHRKKKRYLDAVKA